MQCLHNFSVPFTLGISLLIIRKFPFINAFLKNDEKWGGEGGQMGGGKKSVFWAGYLKKRGRGSEEKLGGGGGLNPGGRGSRPPVLAHGTSTRHRGQVTHRTLKCYRTLKQRKVKTPKVHDTNYANACMFPCQAQVETYITPGLSNALSQWQPYGRAFVYSVYHETFYF